jgi:hypothetical protein
VVEQQQQQQQQEEDEKECIEDPLPIALPPSLPPSLPCTIGVGLAIMMSHANQTHTPHSQSTGRID